MLKGALHTHTTCSDGALTPEELLRVYRDLGFDFVALTDHDFLLKPDAYAGVPGVFEEMIVLKGIERMVFAGGYLHISEIRGGNEILRILNHPAQYAWCVDELLSRLGEIEEKTPIHAVEVTMQGYYTPEYDVPAIDYPKVATDDAHTAEGCGRAWIEVACNGDPDTILRAIKNGDAVVRYTRTAQQSTWLNQGGLSGG